MRITKRTFPTCAAILWSGASALALDWDILNDRDVTLNPCIELFNQLVEEVKAEGGEPAVSRMLTRELARGLFVGGANEIWFMQVLTRLRDTGTPEALRGLEEWLEKDVRARRSLSDAVISMLKPLASEAWFRIREWQCATDPERLLLAVSLFSPPAGAPRLCPTREFVESVVQSHLPAIRASILAALRDPSRRYHDQPADVLRNLAWAVTMDEVRLTPVDAREIVERGGTLGKLIVLHDVKDVPRRESHWDDLRQHAEVHVRENAYRHALVRDMKAAGWDAARIADLTSLSEYMVFLDAVGRAPLGEEAESAKVRAFSFLRSDAYALRSSVPLRDLIERWLREQPELAWTTIRQLGDKPGELSQEEIAAIAEYRASWRKQAQSILDCWGELATKGVEVAKPSEPPPAHQEPKEEPPVAAPGTDGSRIRFRLDGKRIHKQPTEAAGESDN